MSETPENNSRKLSQTSSNGDQDELETYTVQDGDNLNKIAAFHDTTPSKLAQLNKLNSRSYVFPGKPLHLTIICESMNILGILRPIPK